MIIFLFKKNKLKLEIQYKIALLHPKTMCDQVDLQRRYENNLLYNLSNKI